MNMQIKILPSHRICPNCHNLILSKSKILTESHDGKRVRLSHQCPTCKHKWMEMVKG